MDKEGEGMLRHLAYVIHFVEDLERSLAFYTDILEMTVRHRAEGYAELAVEGPKFALLERWRLPALVGESESGLPPPGTHEGEVAFLVQDVDEVYARLCGRGVAFVCAPEDRPWGQRTAYFRDPDGHLIELAMNLH
jgi:lactoylglutathione lyase